MRGAVDAPGKSTDDREPRTSQLAGEDAGDLATVGGGAPRPHHRHGAFGSQPSQPGRVSAPDQGRRRVARVVQRLRVGVVVVTDDPAIGLANAAPKRSGLGLRRLGEQSLGLAAGHRPRQGVVGERQQLRRSPARLAGRDVLDEWGQNAEQLQAAQACLAGPWCPRPDRGHAGRLNPSASCM